PSDRSSPRPRRKLMHHLLAAGLAVERPLDRHGDRGRLFAARRHQPVAHLGEACSPMREGSLADNLSIGRDEADLMGLARPVDAAEKSNIGTHDATSQIYSGQPRCRSIPVLALQAQTPHWTCI